MKLLADVGLMHCAGPNPLDFIVGPSVYHVMYENHP